MEPIIVAIRFACSSSQFFQVAVVAGVQNLTINTIKTTNENYFFSFRQGYLSLRDGTSLHEEIMQTLHPPF